MVGEAGKNAGPCGLAFRCKLGIEEHCFRHCALHVEAGGGSLQRIDIPTLLGTQYGSKFRTSKRRDSYATYALQPRSPTQTERGGEEPAFTSSW